MSNGGITAIGYNTKTDRAGKDGRKGMRDHWNGFAADKDKNRPPICPHTTLL